MGIHPLKIADGYEVACEKAIAHLEKISENVDIEENNHIRLREAAMTALCSKVVSKNREKMADIAIEAILDVADLTRRDVIFDLIKIETKTGGCLEDSTLVRGIVIDKEISHP